MHSESQLQFRLPHAKRDKLSVKDLVQLYEIHRSDAFEWLQQRATDSIEAVVTDPPYGLVEYTEKELAKRENGKGGIWRLPRLSTEANECLYRVSQCLPNLIRSLSGGFCTGWHVY